MNTAQSGLLPGLWSAILAAVTLTGTVVIGCMMPFAAIATIAALALPRRIGLSAVAACWLGNQVIGFGVLGYPWDGPTLTAGLSLLGAGVLAWTVAGGIARTIGNGGAAFAVFAGAFVTYEAALLGYALAFGDAAMFAPHIVGLIALNDGLWFAGLWFGWQLLRLALPGAAARPAA